MSLVSLQSLTIAFGGPPVLENVSLEINKGQRIAFLGRNGAGKSTLMKIIAGEVVPDAGCLAAAPGVRIAYLPQDVPTSMSGSVYEIVASGAGAAGEHLALLHRLTETHADPARIAEVHHALDAQGGWDVEAAVKRALDRVGLDGMKSFETLSGGMRRRVALARALVRDPDLLLLDEPTNHLDIPSITWLESFVVAAKMTVLFITHDRKLLKRLATRIIELDRGALVDWSCDYETFLVRRQAVLDAEEKDWERFDKKLAQEEAWIRRGVRARRTRNEGRVRALVRMREARRARRARSGQVAMTISGAPRSGDRVIEAEGVRFSYGTKPLINDLTTTIMRGDRIGIIGPNGCGKTTLINLLLGTLTPQEGVLKFGVNLQVAYFDQLRGSLDPRLSVWENVAPDHRDTVFINGEPRHVISYLRDFLFTADRAKSPVGHLSGGERNRLMLARMFTNPANVLVFDEPTNDLDTETLELLEEIIGEFNGTVLVVSHDREFLNNVVTATLVFEGDGAVKEYVGGYDDWERQRAAREADRTPDPPTVRMPERTPRTLSKSRLSFNEVRELAEIPARIDRLERRCEEINAQMSDPAYYAQPGFVNGAREELGKHSSELAAAYARWEELDGRALQ